MWGLPFRSPPFDQRRFVLILEDGTALVLDAGERLRMEAGGVEWAASPRPTTGWQDIDAPGTQWT